MQERIGLRRTEKATGSDCRNQRIVDILAVSFFSTAFQFSRRLPMSPRMLPLSQVIEQERRRWMPFRRALSQEDQEAFDRMFACAKQQLQADVRLGRPWGFEVVWIAVLLAHEKRLRQVQGRLAAVNVENRRRMPEGDHPD